MEVKIEAKRKIPRFVWGVAATGFFGLFSTVALFTRLEMIESENERERCERSVQGREDNRAMWLALPQIFPEDAEAFILIVAELDRRLPPLTCENNIPVPNGD